MKQLRKFDLLGIQEQPVCKKKLQNIKNILKQRMFIAAQIEPCSCSVYRGGPAVEVGESNFVFLTFLCRFSITFLNGFLWKKASLPWYLYWMANAEIGAHVRRNICYLICSRHLTRSRVVTSQIFFVRKVLFSFMRAQSVLNYHII